MNRADYENALRNQCMSIPELCEAQISGVLKGIEGSIPAEKMKNIRRVIFTGCGDSYLQAVWLCQLLRNLQVSLHLISPVKDALM
jgi:glucosamine 6-phosphate synthetase-like amidotransferase/phosphosugar isomerase protein